ncbi:MAG: MBL fold metallo-hydrolase [Phycisphaerales bacterium]
MAFGRRKPRRRGFWKRAAAATRSGLRRYPTHLVRSLRGERRRGRLSRLRRRWRRGRGVGVEASKSAPAIIEVSPTAPRFAWPRLPQEPLAASWLGHATALVRVGDLTVLTDPVFSPRIGPRIAGRTMGVSRLMHAPSGMPPPIDVILISHAHFDHLDRPTLRRLVSKRTTVITARHTGRLIPSGFGDVIEIDWDQELSHRGVTFAALRPEHWGARTAWDRHRGFNAYVMRTPRRSVLFAGDTAETRAFESLRPSLAIFGIGAYEPWQHMHATPEQVWDMFLASGGTWLMPIHHSTFELSDEHPDEPMQRLLAAAGEQEPRVVARTAGEVWVARGLPEAEPRS